MSRANGSLEPSLLSTCELLPQRPFEPHRLLWNGHLQTIIGSFQKRTFNWGWQKFETQVVHLTDGTIVQVRITLRDASLPTLIAIHGMAGSCDSLYMLGLSHKAHQKGWNSIRLNLYNTNQSLSAPSIFHAGSSSKTAEIVRTCISKLGLLDVHLVGISLGGNILLKLLGEWAAEAPTEVASAAAISPLINLKSSARLLEKPGTWIYRRYYVKRLRAQALKGLLQYPGAFDSKRLADVRTIREFDEVVTVPLSGYRDVEEYYYESSSFRLLDRVQVPTLILHSVDDPCLSWKELTAIRVRRNPFLLVHLTRRGGHVAFIEGHSDGDLDRSWAENRVIDHIGFMRRNH